MSGTSSMHLHFERNTNAKCDCTILSLSWMGKVPDELPEDEGWKLNRTNYYQEGWLATGNVRGIVGVTFTTSHCKKAVDFPTRTNYNLRGHRSDVMLVKWNEPYQKLASCDSSGIIFVWIKYEGRWSIELINDRNTPVTHFSWSHDGRMALICYQDGFVLVGSVAGQRYWSSMLNLESTITCGIWTPDDQQVYFGTTAGQIIVMDVHGAMVSQVQLSSEVGITMMAWSCEKFKMEEGDDLEPFAGVGKLPQQYTPPPPVRRVPYYCGDSVPSTKLVGQCGVEKLDRDDRIFVLAVSLQDGYIFLMKNFDDVSPIQVQTGLSGPLCLEWSNSRELLAVAGTMQQSASVHSSVQDGGKPAVEYTNVLKFYSDTGVLLYSTLIPYTQSPVTALTWGHNDKRLFVATGPQVHIAWVSRRVASLQLMCRLRILSQLSRESQVAVLPLPPRIKALISNLFAQTIRCCVPDSTALREFVSRPPAGSIRLHCTMIRHDDDSNTNGGTCYTLYLEYLGGLVPLLKGKRTSKIRPEFVIFDPQLDELTLTIDSGESAKSSGSSQNAASDTSDTEREEGCGSPRVQRRKRRRNKSHNGYCDRGIDGDHDEIGYVNNLPDHVRLVEVTSNIWGTKFKIHGLGSCVPANLGQVTYKTSLLHLQPRQMTLVMTELRDDFPPGPDPTFNPNLFSEDEEETYQHEELGHLETDSAPPIAPMTPRPVPGGTCFQSCLKSQIPPPPTTYEYHTKSMESTSSFINGNLIPMLAKAESYEDEFPYVDLQDVIQYCDSLYATSSPSNTPSASKTYSGVQVSTAATFNNGVISNTSRNTATTPSTTETTVAQASRHVSSLVCEGVVPNLQSPKNAIAPSEVLECNISSQTMVTAATSSSHSNNVQRMKSGFTEQHDQNKNGLNLNLNVGTIEQSTVDLRPLVMKRIDSDVNYSRIHHLCGKAISNEDMENTENTARPKKHNNITSPVKPTNNSSIIPTTKCKEKFLISPTSSQEFYKFSAGKPEDLQYIDEDCSMVDSLAQSSVKRTPTTIPIAPVYVPDSMVRSCSVGYLDLVEAQMVPNDMSLFMLPKEVPKRLVLVNKKSSRQKRQRNRNHHQAQHNSSIGQSTSRPLHLKHCGKSRSLDSSDIFPSMDSVIPLPPTEEKCSQIKQGSKESVNEVTLDSANSALENSERTSSTSVITSTSPVSNTTQTSTSPSLKKCSNMNSVGIQLNNTDKLVMLASMKLNCKELLEESRSLPPSCQSSPRLPHSSPASPAPSKKSGKRNQSSSPIRRHLLNSPLLSRRQRKSKATTESSDDEVVHSGDEVFNGKNYHNLESFQKAQLRQKLKRVKCKGDCSPSSSSPHRREFVMHNKAPMWNENSQVYQLDFGGRVTQESAKNFQIEFRGKQVMQFGRIDGNAYTLDFQYPFSALQAFAVALANVTQRLK